LSEPSAEVYTPGYVTNASNFMANRRAATHAAFLMVNALRAFGHEASGLFAQSWVAVVAHVST